MTFHRLNWIAVATVLLYYLSPANGQTTLPVPVVPGGTPPPQIIVPTRSIDQSFKMRFASPNSSTESYAIAWYGGNPSAPLVDFLAMPHVQKQIEFSDEQKKMLKDFQKKLSSEYATIRKKYPRLEEKSLPREERSRLNRTVNLKYQEIKKELSKELEESLVPQQLKLIDQVKFNQSVQMYGLARTLTQGHFKDLAKISASQKTELEKIKKDSEAAIQKKIEEMRKDAKAKMLKVLDRKQKDQLKEWEGDPKKALPIRL